MRQGELWTEKQSERAHGSCQARLAKEREAFDIRPILRHEFEYSHDIRWIEWTYIEPERSGRPRLCTVDR